VRFEHLSQRAIAALYSALAERLYDPIIAVGALSLLGGELPAHIREQGVRAAAHAVAKPILDVPVGTGYFSTAMAARHDGLVVGVDIAAGMVAKATRSAARAGTPNLLAVRGDARHLPFGDDVFGAVTCWNGLHAMPHPLAAVAELRRVLAPSGTLFVSVISLPLGVLVGEQVARRLPALLRPHGHVTGALVDGGLVVTSVTTDRLGALIEATKPPLKIPAAVP
jgi:ubiquinone/menaquinone biosynthesis C-methylase UbiE